MTWEEFLNKIQLGDPKVFDCAPTYWGQLTEEQKKNIFRNIKNESELLAFLNAMKEHAYSVSSNDDENLYEAANLDDVFLEYVVQTIENVQDESIKTLCLEILAICNESLRPVIESLIYADFFQYEGSFLHGIIALTARRENDIWYLETGGPDFVDEVYTFENMWDLLQEMVIYPFLSIEEPEFLRKNKKTIA